jgi:plasmid stabilization system protein ParE
MHAGKMPDVIYASEASVDIAEAYAWYEKREFGLGEEFLRSIAACVSLIKRHPFMYPLAVDEFRRALIRRFPFELFYEPSDDRVTIYAVFHCSQDPEKWRSRLKNVRS